MRRTIGIVVLILSLTAFCYFIYWAKWGQYNDVQIISKDEVTIGDYIGVKTGSGLKCYQITEHGLRDVDIDINRIRL